MPPSSARRVALGKFHAQLDQFLNPRRAFLDDGADDAFLAQTRARRERVAHVQLERILLARHRRDAALRVIGVRLRAVLFGDDGHAPARRDLERERKPRDAAAENEIIKLFHGTGKLTQRRQAAKQIGYCHFRRFGVTDDSCKL